MEVRIRRIATNDEYQACVELQRLVWGEEFTERVPLAILKVGQRIGGVTAGAFDADGRLLGFVFGLTGVEGARLVHWSDMLAVRPELRDRGIGQRLKAFQRSELQSLGVERIYWTFDPLVARNAYLNLVRLGAEAIEYVTDMYGSETASELHRGVGTDRLVICWRIDEQGARGASDARPPPVETGAGGPTHLSGDPAPLPLVEVEGERPVLRPAVFAASQGSLLIGIPRDIESIQRRSLPLAAEWRAVTRQAFARALEEGYRIVGFARTTDSPLAGQYRLARDRRRELQSPPGQHGI